ncbi:MAG: hypothetical protein WCC10_02465, partial [Tumebacillaceae bacterium]
MNKKVVATLVLSTLAVSALSMNAANAANDKQVLKDEKAKVHNVVGKLGKVTGATAEERGLNALEKVKADFGFAKAQGNFKVKASHTDENGVAHTKFTQTINGIPVAGHEMIVHEIAGDVQGVTGDFANLVPNASKATLTDAQAIDRAVANTGFTGDLSRPATAELAYVEKDGKAVLAYNVNVAYLDSAEPGNWKIAIDATNGSIIDAFNALAEDNAAVGTGTGVLGDTKSINTYYYTSYGNYYLEDHTKAMTGDIETYTFNNGSSAQYDMPDADNVWNSSTQKAGVDAHYYAGKVYD